MLVEIVKVCNKLVQNALFLLQILKIAKHSSLSQQTPFWHRRLFLQITNLWRRIIGCLTARMIRTLGNFLTIPPKFLIPPINFRRGGATKKTPK